MQSPRAAVAKHFALSGAALLVFGLYLSWPFTFSWSAVVANVAALATSGIGLRLVGFLVATGGVALLLQPRYPAAAEWVGALAVLALLYPLFGLAAGLPKLSGWPGLFVSVGAICLAAGGSAWLFAAACGSELRQASWFGALSPHAAASSAARQSLRAADSHDNTPACPQCEAPMVRRTAQHGKNAGQTFWGCSRYPNCQTIQPAS